MTATPQREIERIIERFTSNYSISRTAKSHFKVELRRGDQSVTIFHSGTPSDPRANKNFKAQVRRAWIGIGGRA